MSTHSVLNVMSPVTGELVAALDVTTPAELDAVVKQAADAQRTWRETAPAVRSQIIWRWGELIEQYSQELAAIDSRCTGKVLRDAVAETTVSARNARYWAGMADKLFGEQLADVPGRLSYTVREPLGVYGVILPWNGPAHSFVARCSPALACGNAVVVKPSELSPLSALRLAELALEAGFPEHLLQVLVGPGDVGRLLVEHPGVHGVSFTGSVPTGRSVAVAASAQFKPLTLELGGKSPTVVFADADLEQAAKGVLHTIFNNAGQICAAGSRLLVHSSIAESFTQRLVELASTIVVGDPAEAGTHLGPVASVGQYERVMSFLAAAGAEGAQAALGGGRPDHLSEVGCYIAPTILTGVTPGMKVATEEIFGPVLSVLEFDTEQEALAMANDTEHGLAAYVWTRDIGVMGRMVAGIEAGVVHGNTSLVMDASLPFGGFKDSGVGNAYGSDAINGCTQTKRVTLRTAAEPMPSAWFTS